MFHMSLEFIHSRNRAETSELNGNLSVRMSDIQSSLDNSPIYAPISTKFPFSAPPLSPHSSNEDLFEEGIDDRENTRLLYDDNFSLFNENYHTLTYFHKIKRNKLENMNHFQV